METLEEILGPSHASDTPAIIIPGENPMEVKYHQLHQDVKHCQNRLAALGISKQAAVSIALPNSYEFIVVFLATTWQRGIAAPLNPGYKQDEFDFYIDDLGSTLAVVPHHAYEKNSAPVRAAKKHSAAIVECYWNGTEVVLDLKDAGKLRGREDAEVTMPSKDDIALMLHTSGTTGRPKAVPLTHENLTKSVDNIIKSYTLSSQDRTMLIMPLFHVHGLLASFLSTLGSGGTVVIPARLQPSFWKDFETYGSTWYTATPTMHQVLLQFPFPEKAPSKLRFIRSCSSPLSETLFHRVESKFQAPVLEAYAMTEASHQISSNPLPPRLRKPGTVGLPCGVGVQILGEDGKQVPPGTQGEVCIQGLNVTKGYLNNPSANASSFTSKGFFRTGDFGMFHEEGFLILTGRIKEFINKGGEKISPVELDNVISQHPAIAEVVTFAMEDDMYGQDVGVAVKIKEGEQLPAAKLKKWIGERVASHKIPNKIYFPDQIPKTATGKVQRKTVAEKMTTTN